MVCVCKQLEQCYHASFKANPTYCMYLLFQTYDEYYYNYIHLQNFYCYLAMLPLNTLLITVRHTKFLLLVVLDMLLPLLVSRYCCSHYFSYSCEIGAYKRSNVPTCRSTYVIRSMEWRTHRGAFRSLKI